MKSELQRNLFFLQAFATTAATAQIVEEVFLVARRNKVVLNSLFLFFLLYFVGLTFNNIVTKIETM